MALSLQVYNESNKFNAQNNSLLGKSNGFIVSLCHNAFWQYNADYWRLPGNDRFKGIMLEDLSLNFQTSWSDAGGAILGKKIESFLNSKFVKMLAGQSDHGFSPFICSDAWTQQKMSGDAQPVKVQLKFKAYNNDRMGCTNYNDILRFLIHICSPVKSSTQGNNPKTRGGLGDDIGSTLNDVVDGTGNLINTVVDSGKTFVNGFKEDDIEGKNKFATAAAQVVEVANNTYNKLLGTTANGKNNANFTVNFSLNNKIFDRNTHMEITKPGEVQNETAAINTALDWIVTNFSFKPSRQFTYSNDENDKDFGLPKPLWMDFDLSLETRLSLSNQYVYNVIIPNELRIKTGQ